MSDILSDVGGFAKGFGQGIWGGAKGMVQGLGNLAEGAYDIATDPNARAQAWNDAVNAAQTAEWAVQNPGQAASDIGQGATNLYNNFVTAEQQAAANGQSAQFWGNLAGEGTFAAGTVLVPGLAEGKLAGAAGELGDASQLVKGATALEDAAPALGEAADGAASALPDPGALSFVPENSGVAQSAAGQAWRDYQAQTLGSDMDPVAGQANVPALDFENPNPNGNPYVKWDGYQLLPDGTTELIDAKTAISPFSTADGPFVPQSTLDQLVNKSAALDQNPGYSGVIEVPTDQAASDAQAALDNLGIDNIDVRVRPFQDATSAVPDAAADDTSIGDAGTTAAPADVPDPALDATTPAADGDTSLLNTSSLAGAGLLGAGAAGNLLAPATQTDAATDTAPAPTDTAPSTQPLYSATYGVNPDGSLTTLSPPTLVSPGDTSATPPVPIIPAPVDTTPIHTSPIDTTPVDTSPIESTPIDTDPVDTDPIDTDPVDTTDTISAGTDPTDTTSADSTPSVTPDPDVDSSGDLSGIDGGGGGGMDDMAAMDC